MTLRNLAFWLVDVFAREPLSGNGLSIFLLDEDLPASAMQRLTQEMRQFETIFLRQLEPSSRFKARIFTTEEELPFAGHPIIGAAALLHSELFAVDDSAHLEFVMPDRLIRATSRREGESYLAEMDQGQAAFGPPLPAEARQSFSQALNLSVADLAADLPLQVVSTGLPYLIVPIRSNLDRSRIVAPGFSSRLAEVGARFVYVFDVDHLEGRTWDNQGLMEDVATGSAAGPTGAYLVRHGLAIAGHTIILAQGRFLNRPSELQVTVQGQAELRTSVRGQVCFIGQGSLSLPETLLQTAVHGG